VLAKHIHKELSPVQDEDEECMTTPASFGFPLQTVESAIMSVCKRNNYGLDGIPGGPKLPTALCIWRWEVNEQYRDWLPKVAKEKAEARMAERAQVRHRQKL
jgi:chromatin assembly factor 1 subunit A